MTDVTSRTIREHEYDEWNRVVVAAFGGFPEAHVTELEDRLRPMARNIAAFLGDQLIAAAASYAFDMTVPGGDTIPVSGLTAVGALGTHRRRGALRAMMLFDLEAAAARGEVASILNASESNIYGRFGYGLAQQYQTLRIQTDKATFDPRPPARALTLVPKADAAPQLTSMFEAYRVTRAGEVSRPEAWWDGVLGDVATWKGGGAIFVVVAEPDGDDPGGYVIYELLDGGVGVMKRMVVRELVAATAATEAALWQYCVELDLVGEVEMTGRPLDDPIRWRLTDPRQLQVTRQSDFVWVRLLDVPAAMATRAYGTEGEIVVAVTDQLRPDTGGTYVISGSPKGGACTRTTAAADLELTIAELGALYLGGVDASALASAGRIHEVHAGAIDLADGFFGWSCAPFCTTRF